MAKATGLKGDCDDESDFPGESVEDTLASFKESAIAEVDAIRPKGGAMPAAKLQNPWQTFGSRTWPRDPVAACNTAFDPRPVS